MLWPLVGIYKRIPATQEALCVSFLEIITIVCNYLFATDGFTSLRCRLDMRLGFQDPRRSLVAPRTSPSIITQLPVGVNVQSFVLNKTAGLVVLQVLSHFYF